MELDKAIEILQLNLDRGGKRMPPDVKGALQIGIEALTREQYHRRCHPNQSPTPLPSETPTDDSP